MKKPVVIGLKAHSGWAADQKLAATAAWLSLAGEGR